jgi:hypothetical protein
VTGPAISEAAGAIFRCTGVFSLESAMRDRLVLAMAIGAIVMAIAIVIAHHVIVADHTN